MPIWQRIFQDRAPWRHRNLPKAVPPRLTVFISYASADLARAEALFIRLRAAGLVVWFDRARLRPGCRWYDEIEAGCVAARVMLPLITPRWRVSEWTWFETYVHDDIIPILAEGRAEDVLPPPLRAPQAVAFDPLAPDETAAAALVAEIRARLAAPAPEKASACRARSIPTHSRASIIWPVAWRRWAMPGPPCRFTNAHWRRVSACWASSILGRRYSRKITKECCARLVDVVAEMLACALVWRAAVVHCSGRSPDSPKRGLRNTLRIRRELEGVQAIRHVAFSLRCARGFPLSRE